MSIENKLVDVAANAGEIMENAEKTTVLLEVSDDEILEILALTSSDEFTSFLESRDITIPEGGYIRTKSSGGESEQVFSNLAELQSFLHRISGTMN